jgi:diphthine methyl ester synthase
MPLYLVGLGLGNENDVSVNGLAAIKRSERVFLEHYTSILGVPQDKLEKFYGKKVELADRTRVESEADVILEAAKTQNVSFLVVGDPYCATTHTDLALRARAEGIKVTVFHNACIMSAVGCCGLQLYNYGMTISICFFRDGSEDNAQPTSYYEKIKINRQHGLHTLCLLDIKVKEPDLDELCKGRTVFLPPRFMTVAQALQQLLYVEENIYRGGVYSRSTQCVGLVRIGREDQLVVAGSMGELATLDFGGPLHSLVIVGETHELESEMLAEFSIHEANLPTVPWDPRFTNTVTARRASATVVAPPAAVLVPNLPKTPASVSTNDTKAAESDVEEMPMTIVPLVCDNESSSEEGD